MPILFLGAASATAVFARFQRLLGVLRVSSILILIGANVHVIDGRPASSWMLLMTSIAGYFLETVKVPLAPSFLA